MKNPPSVLKYGDLLAEIGQLYEAARHAVVEAYWQIGKRLVEVEQGGAARAQYGEGLLERLSVDLSARYGQGFSVVTIRRMRAFYLSHPKRSAPTELAWTQFVELMPVRDVSARARLERRAETEHLSSRELRRLVRQESGSVEPAQPRETPLRRPGGLKFNSYRAANAPGIPVPDGHILVDCGFYVYRLIPKTARGFELTPRPAYTYPAVVERVVDGDTVWALVNVGFGTVLREKLRMHGLDARETTSPQGKEALDYVARQLPPDAPIVVRSYASDAFGRFLADIFYLPPPVPDVQSPATFDRILSGGIFLNQELLAKGLAVRMMT